MYHILCVVSQNGYYGHFNDTNCNAIVIWWYELWRCVFYILWLEEKYVITLSFTLMEYIKNGNCIEFNNIIVDTTHLDYNFWCNLATVFFSYG